MAFVKFEVDSPSKPEVTIKGDTIYLTPGGVAGAGIGSAGTVALYYDASQHRIGIASADEGEASGFKVRHSSRGGSIKATAFMERFSLSGATATGNLHTAEGLTAFNVNMPSLIGVRSGERPYTGKKRGRKPKNYVPEPEPGGDAAE